MNWQDIKVSIDNTHFLFEGNSIFDKYFIEVLKFHTPGLAPVKDETGAYHIDINGNSLYKERFSRTFGYYCNQAAVVLGLDWFHLTESGKRAYSHHFAWTGNFQENCCTVRDKENRYYHIDLNGDKIYKDTYLYCGDFKDGYACVKIEEDICKHIDVQGNFLNEKSFLDLGVFHKSYATAKDTTGWYHIDMKGNALYNQRYLAIEPFYNGYALVTEFDDKKIIIDEKGDKIIGV